jgi:hypothetical protein
MVRRWLPVLVGALIIELLWLVAWRLDRVMIWQLVS